MKVIDLLNKIANGEEIPQLIKWNGYIYDKLGCEYYMLNDRDITLFGDILDTNGKYLNDEVEKVVEDKKIEKLEIVHNGSPNAYALLNEYGTKCALTKHSKVMCDKINEIIDKLNEMEKE